jgi:branched-chain amino acid transport system ATP-binding protein
MRAKEFPLGDLVVEGLCAGYGEMQVVYKVSYRVASGKITALLGRNGAGKTTTLHATVGLRFSPGRGQVLVEGIDVSNRPGSKMAGVGLALVPEGHRIFTGLSVADNLRVGAFSLRSRRRAHLNSAFERVFELFPNLATDRERPAEQLSGGQQQMLAIAQALMSEPRFLLMDEPSAGLAPTVVDRIYEVIRTLAAQGCGILLVEQDVQRAMALADRTYVMDRGKIVMEGDSAELSANGLILDLIRGVMEGSADDGAATP